jgi:DNA-binding NtrC family response regulator
MAIKRILLVDDDEVITSVPGELLKHHGFDVTTAASVCEALKFVSSETYDVLLSALHTPRAGGGLTVVSAMHHANPRATTILPSVSPEIDTAAHAILLQDHEILLKPVDITTLVDAIEQGLASGSAGLRLVETVATILERSTESSIQTWFPNSFKQTD